MTAADLRWGRGGGRHIPPAAVIPGIDDVATVLAICPHGHRWWLAEADYDEPPRIDGREVHRSTVCAPCVVDGHRTRRAKPQEIASPPTIIRTVTAAGLPCACGSAA